MAAVHSASFTSLTLENNDLASASPPPSYQEAIGPSLNLALRKDLVNDLPTNLIMEAVLNDYWVYTANQDLIFRTHTLVVAQGTKVTHIPSNSKAYVMQTRKRKSSWPYHAETIQDGKAVSLFEIEPHDKFIKGEVAQMKFRNDFTNAEENLEIRRNRVDQRWDVYHQDQRMADIKFPSSSSRWKIRLVARGIDPSILIAITLVIIVGAKKLEG